MIPLVLSLLLGAPVQAQDLKKPSLALKVSPYDVTLQTITFPSGLRVVMQRDEKATFTNVATTHSGGDALDKPGKEGTSHLAVHMFYTAKMGDATVRDQLYARGVDYNTDSIQDWVLFRSTGPLSALPTILAAEGIRMDNLLAGQTEEALQGEKVIFGLEPYYDDGGFMRAMPQIKHALHGPDSPWGETREHLAQTNFKAVTMEDISEYSKVAFAPENTTIAISGAIDFSAVIAMLFKHLPPNVIHKDATTDHLKTFFKPGIVDPDENNPDHVTVWLEDPTTKELVDLTDKPTERVTWKAPEPYGRAPSYDGEVIHLPGKVETPIAVVSWAVPGQWVGQDALKIIAATGLGTAGGASWGATFEIAKGNTGGAQAGCGNYVYLNAGQIVCTAIARDDRVNANELTDKLKAPASIFWDPQTTFLREQATEVGRQRALGAMLHGLEQYDNMTQGLASAASLDAHFQGDPRYRTQLMNETMALDGLTVRPWVQAWLGEARAVSLVVDPIPKDQWLSIPREVAYHGSIAGHRIPTSGDVPSNEDVAAAYQGPDLTGAVEKTLGNGLRVVVIPHGSVPIASVVLASPAGAASGDGIDMLGEITMRRIWNEIYDDPTGRKQELLPERMAAESVLDRGSDVTWEGFAAPKDNLEGALYLLRRNEMARKVNLAGKNAWWKATQLELPRAWDNRSWWAQQERLDRVLGDHPVKWVMSQDDALRLKDMSASDLVTWYNKKFKPSTSVLVIAGAVDPAQALAFAESSWGSWKDQTSENVPAMPARPTPAGPATLFFDADGANHALIGATCPLQAPTASNSPAQQVAAAALQEELVTRLESAGAAALASTATGNEAAGLSWLDFYVVVPHDKVAEAVTAIKQTLDVPAAKSLNADQVQRHKLRLAGIQLYKQTSSRALAKAAGEVYLQPYRGKSWYADWGTALAEVDLDAIAASTAGCAENAVITIETKSEALSALKEKFGAERVDWQKKSDDELMTWDKGAYKRRLKLRAKGK